MDERARSFTFRAILMGVSLVSLSQTIVATALPRITADLEGTDRYAWVATAYLVASVVVMLPAGRLADIVNPRLLLLGSTSLFLLGSLLCGMAPSMDALIAARALQGVGGGALVSVNAAVLGLIYPPRERGAVMGVYTATVAVSSVCGPLLGGILSDTVGWRSVFYAPLPVGMLALVFLWKFMPNQPPASTGRMDWVGTVALTGAILPVLVGFSSLGMKALALSALMVVCFVVIESRQADPLFELGLMRNAVFSLCNLAGSLAGATMMVASIYIPLYLVGVACISPTLSGLVLSPLMLGATLGSVWAGRALQRTGQYRWLLVGGALMNVACLAALQHLLGNAASIPWILGALLPFGLSLGIILPIITVAVQSSVPRERMGTASSSVQFFRTFGSALGMAVTGTILTATLHSNLIGHLPAEATRHGAQNAVMGFNEEAAIHRRFEKHMAALHENIHGAVQGDETARLRLAGHPLLHQSLEDGVKRRTNPALLEQQMDERAAAVARALENSVHTALRLTLIDATSAIFLFALALAVVGAAACLMVPQQPLPEGDSGEAPSGRG